MRNKASQIRSILNHAFDGKLNHLRDRLLSPSEHMRDALTLDQILSPEFFDVVCSNFEQTYGKTPRVAVLSIWSKWYFTVVLPPLLASSVWARCVPPLKAEKLVYHVAEDNKVTAVGAQIGWTINGPGPDFDFAVIHGAVVAPFINRYSAFSGVSKRVLWSNAGTAIDSFLFYLSRDGGYEDGVDLARKLLGGKLLADRRINKLHNAVEHHPEGGRRRKVCCLRYMVPDGQLCCICPKTTEGHQVA